MRSHSLAISLVLAPAVAVLPLTSSCAAETGGPFELASLPSALVVCPTEARVGIPFEIDGEGSESPLGPFAEASLRLEPGAQEMPALRGTFTVASSGLATASLVVVDVDGNRAEAHCRFPVQGSDGAPGVEDPAPNGEPVDLSGTFALVAYDRPELQGSALDPARQCADAPQLSLVTMEQVGTRVSMTLQTCALTMPNVNVFMAGLQETTVPAAFLDALPVIGPIDVELGAAVVGATFAPSPSDLGAPQVVGAALPSATDPLPSDAGDERVRDDDGDGEPGGTLNSTWGDQPIVYRRSLRALAGVVLSSDEVDGSTEGSFRVDAESALLTPFAFLVPTGEGLPSTFRLLRVDGAHDTVNLANGAGSITCDDVRAHTDELLARAPPPATPSGCASF